jgi:beta-aspartyl-peptidase (threonine type)
MQGYGRAITLARRVMAETPHVLVVARGAERLAAELGETPQDQRTAEALRRWRERFTERDSDAGRRATICARWRGR